MHTSTKEKDQLNDFSKISVKSAVKLLKLIFLYFKKVLLESLVELSSIFLCCLTKRISMKAHRNLMLF